MTIHELKRSIVSVLFAAHLINLLHRKSLMSESISKQGLQRFVALFYTAPDYTPTQPPEDEVSLV